MRTVILFHATHKKHRNNIFLFSVLTLLYLSQPQICYSARCDNKLKPTSDNSRYADRGNRCEGTYKEKEVSGQINLIGYLKGRLNYNLSKDKTLNLSIPDNIRHLYSSVNLRAQPFSSMTFYRMDATIDSGRRLTWPIKDVLKPNSLDNEKISVYGFSELRGKDNKQYKVYLPVVAKINQHKIHDKDLRLYLSSSLDISSLTSNWKCGDQPDKEITIEEEYESDEPILIFPPAQLRGSCKVHIRAVIKQDDPDDKSNIINSYLTVQLDR